MRFSTRGPCTICPHRQLPPSAAAGVGLRATETSPRLAAAGPAPAALRCADLASYLDLDARWILIMSADRERRGDANCVRPMATTR
jgi:hypothetical protein